MLSVSLTGSRAILWTRDEDKDENLVPAHVPPSMEKKPDRNSERKIFIFQNGFIA